MKCDVSYRELAEFAAGELDDERAATVQRHLPSCDACRRRLEAVEVVDGTLRALPRLAPPAGAVLATRRLLSAEVRGPGAPEIMTLDEVAEFLRIDVDDLREVVIDLPAFEIAGKVRVRRSRLVEWIQTRERAYARALAESEVTATFAALD